MKLEIVDEDSYKIFINNNYDNSLHVNDKEDLGKFIKSIILKIRRIYNILLEGLYEVDVYIIKFIGIVLEIRNIDSYLSKSVDLKIIVHSDEDIYLKIYDYELLRKYHHLKYLNNYFYLNINNLLEKDVYGLVENYDIVYGEELDDLKKEWHSLTI